MIDNETIRKASEMGIIDVIDAVNTVESILLISLYHLMRKSR